MSGFRPPVSHYVAVVEGVEGRWRRSESVVTLLPVFVAGRRLGLLLAVTGMLAAAVACGGGPDRPRTLPPIASTTPAADVSSAPAHHSHAADLAAVKAVVREYFRAKNQLPRTMDAEALARVTAQGCTCRDLVHSVRRLRSQHESYFGRSRLTSITATLDGASFAQALVTYNSTAGGTRDSAGGVLYRGHRHSGVRQVFYLRQLGSAWLITDIVLVDAGTIR
jgi:hypothetical protein